MGLYLAFNTTLLDVAVVRSTKPVKYVVTRNYEAYECLVGVPYGYGYLIDKEVVFLNLDSLTLHGPWLVVDVEAKHHYPQMLERNLLADVNCEEYMHKKGVLIYASATKILRE